MPVFYFGSLKLTGGRRQHWVTSSTRSCGSVECNLSKLSTTQPCAASSCCSWSAITYSRPCTVLNLHQLNAHTMFTDTCVQCSHNVDWQMSSMLTLCSLTHAFNAHTMFTNTCVQCSHNVETDTCVQCSHYVHWHMRSMLTQRWDWHMRSMLTLCSLTHAFNAHTTLRLTHAFNAHTMFTNTCVQRSHYVH